jgi:hypothetical protein
LNRHGARGCLWRVRRLRWRRRSSSAACGRMGSTGPGAWPKWAEPDRVGSGLRAWPNPVG